MAPLARQIFSGFTNPSIIDTTATFTQCDYLLLNAIGIGADELEIAAALQIQTVAEIQFLNQAIATQTLPTKEVILDVATFDTATIIPIPYEATVAESTLKVCLSTSSSVLIEIYAVYHNPCLCADELQDITDLLEQQALVSNALAINAVAQDVVLLATATLIGTVAAPFTFGASLSLPALASATLPLGVSQLTGLGLLLPFGI